MPSRSDAAKKTCAHRCVFVFSIAALLTLVLLEGCAAKDGSANQFTSQIPEAKTAPRVQEGLSGQFRADPQLKASDVSPLQLYSTGCATAGSTTPAQQIDSRLVQGDWITETFEDATVLKHRHFSLDLKVSDVDTTGQQIQYVGRYQAASVTNIVPATATTPQSTVVTPQVDTEFTRQCRAQTTSGTASIVCTDSPLVDAAETEPCTFNSAGTVTKTTTPGYFQAGDRDGHTEKKVYMISEVDRGDLICDATHRYLGVTRTNIEIVSNEEPTTQTSTCGGAVLRRTLTIEDSKRNVYYSSNRSVVFHSRF